MTKKDYEAFANAIHSRVYSEDFVNICVEVFQADNPMFKKDKFIEACQTGKHIRKTIKGVA